MAKVGENSAVIDLIRAIIARRSLIRNVMMAGFVLIFSALALIAPDYEWDLLAYTANASQLATGLSALELHGPIYENLKQSLPPAAYDSLTGTPSRLILSQDPEAFRQTVAFFYDSRVIYTTIIAGFIKLGMEPFMAIYMFSTLCGVLSALLLARLIPVSVPLGLYFILPFIALSCGLLTVARLATPDAFATLTTITLYYLLIRNRITLLLFALPVVIFIRTDMIILTALFFAYFFLTNRISKVAVIASGMATIAAYLYLNNIIVDADPWTSLIGYNFGDKPTHPDEYVFDVTFFQYLSYIAIGLKSFSYNPIFFVFCMLTVTGIVLFSARFLVSLVSAPVSLQHGDLLFLLVSCATYLAIHFLLFPVAWTRFFAAQYSLVAVTVVWATLSILAERNYSSRDNMDLLSQ